MNLTVDGKQIQTQKGTSVLNAALDAGIYIPHLCSHPDLEAKGGCRLCMVEIDGISDAVPACMTECEENMTVNTHGEQAEKIRKMSMELILATHPADCTGCPKYGKCELQSLYQYMGVSPERWRKKSRPVPNDDSNPLIQHLLTRCVRCGRCIRACHDLRGVKVLDYVEDKSGVHAGVPNGKSLADAGCRFCGACIEVCPTGSIMDAIGIMDADKSYNENIVPCRTQCPAHIDIPRYIRLVKEGENEQAVSVIREKVPFPQTLGRVCNHACEQQCKRNELNEPVSICRLKLSAASQKNDAWKKFRKTKPDTKNKIAIVGSGPAGLTTAYYLRKQGHQTVVFEANEKAGGQCRYGIPAYRLSDEILDKEIADILEVGIELKTKTYVENPVSLLEQGFDAVVVAVGTHAGIRLPIPGNDLQNVTVSTDFLKEVANGTVKSLEGKSVVVLGGGNVAFDCAGSAVRLGASQVHLACLESRDNMLASPDEVAEREEEGVILHTEHSFISISGNDKAEAVALQKVKSFRFDENNKAVIELHEHSQETVEADVVIFAVGQRPKNLDSMNIPLSGAYIDADENGSVNIPGIYAIGDAVTGTKSVIAAIAAGRNCASTIDKYLGGDGNISETLTEKTTPSPYIGQCEGFAGLQRNSPECVGAKERVLNFDCYEIPFSPETAKNESERCLQCDLRLDITRPKLWNEY